MVLAMSQYYKNSNNKEPSFDLIFEFSKSF